MTLQNDISFALAGHNRVHSAHTDRVNHPASASRTGSSVCGVNWFRAHDRNTFVQFYCFECWAHIVQAWNDSDKKNLHGVSVRASNGFSFFTRNFVDAHWANECQCKVRIHFQRPFESANCVRLVALREHINSIKINPFWADSTPKWTDTAILVTKYMHRRLTEVGYRCWCAALIHELKMSKKCGINAKNTR